MRGSWVSPFYLNCRQEIEPVANSNRPAFPASAPRRCARALPHLQVACTERCVPCHHAGQDTIFPACSSEAESGAWRPGRGGKDRFAQQTWMNLNAEVSVNGAVVHTWSLVRGQRGDHRGLKRADPRAERDTRVTAGRTGKEVEQEGGVAVRVTTTDERVAKAWKATKKRRYYPSSYVGLFRKSLDVYFSNTSKVICLLDYFIHNFFFCDRTSLAVHMLWLLFLLSALLQKSETWAQLVLSKMLCGLLHSPVTAMPLAKGGRGGRREMNRRQQRGGCAFCRRFCAKVWI